MRVCGWACAVFTAHCIYSNAHYMCERVYIYIYVYTNIYIYIYIYMLGCAVVTAHFTALHMRRTPSQSSS